MFIYDRLLDFFLDSFLLFPFGKSRIVLGLCAVGFLGGGLGSNGRGDMDIAMGLLGIVCCAVLCWDCSSSSSASWFGEKERKGKERNLTS